MAYLSRNDFPGDGTTTLREINFKGNRPDATSGTVPYIDSDDVKAVQITPATADAAEVVVDLTCTYVGPNQFNCTPASPVGTIVRVYRSTENEYPLVDYQNLQNVSESDLDLANRQAVFIVEEALDASTEAVDKAEDATTIAYSAMATSEDALSEAQSAVTTANSALSAATNAVAVATAADTIADQALASAQDAVDTANGIAATAQDALDTADAAVATANTAAATANGIAATANSALTSAQAAVTTANSASTVANAASVTANGIAATANTALTNANSAVTTANNAATTANGIAATANSALSTANTANSTANSANSTAAAAQAAAAIAVTTAGNKLDAVVSSGTGVSVLRDESPDNTVRLNDLAVDANLGISSSGGVVTINAAPLDARLDVIELQYKRETFQVGGLTGTTSVNVNWNDGNHDWVKKVTVNLISISNNAAASFALRMRADGVTDSTGAYVVTVSALSASSMTTALGTAALQPNVSVASATSWHGRMCLEKVSADGGGTSDTASWMYTGQATLVATAGQWTSCGRWFNTNGSKMNGLSLGTVAGTATFSTGTFSVVLES